MTVYEREKRVHHRYVTSENTASYPIIGVQLHKTATNQVEAFALEEQEEMWFKVYFEQVRPTLLKEDSQKKQLFLSTSGHSIYNVSNDLQRYHERIIEKNEQLSQDLQMCKEKLGIRRTSFVVRGFYLPRLEKTNDFAFSLSGQFKAFSHPPLACWGKPFLLLNSVLCHCYKFTHLRSELHRSPERLLVCFQV